MNRAELVGLVLAVLGLFLGIPGLVILIAGESGGKVALLLVGFLLLFAAGCFILWYSRSSPWTVTRNSSTLTLLDAAGTHAKFRKTSTLRSNRFSQRRYTHTMYVDGNPPLDSFDAGPRVHRKTIEVSQYFVEVEFPTDVGLFGVRETWIEVDLINCFRDVDEPWLNLDPTLPVRRAEMEVIFPPDRPPISAEAIYTHVGRTKHLGSVPVQGRRIHWKCPGGLFGLKRGSHKLIWRW